MLMFWQNHHSQAHSREHFLVAVDLKFLCCGGGGHEAELGLRWKVKTLTLTLSIRIRMGQRA